MRDPGGGGGRGAISIRVRLGLALAIALLPVLALSAVQSVLNFRREAAAQQTSLAAAAERSAATARARIESAEVLMETVAPGSVGFQCAPRLIDLKRRIKGYANLIRFDAIGRVACAADSAPADPLRRTRSWFTALQGGKPVVAVSDAGVPYASEPSLLAAVRAETPDGRFDGALVAVLSLSSLRPETTDRSLPSGAEVALADAQGHYLSLTRAEMFPASLDARLSGKARSGPSLWLGQDRRGVWRVFSSAPLVGEDVFVILSAPSRDLVSWAWVNPLTALALPILAFTLALIAVWIATERGVIRWIAYLQRVAAIYARGRFSVHPFKAEAAPPEIRDLAETLDLMAEAIAARDAALRENLAEKDGLMREIHHRVKNNLQIISSLLNMQQRALTDPAARTAMSDTRLRIAALALIHRSVYQGPDLVHVNLKDFMDELIAQLVTAEPRRGGAVRTELDIDPLVIDPDRLAPLSLFAVEAITNARKHGMGDAGGELAVTLAVRGDSAELTISDSGAQAGASPQIGDGVGRTLMTAFARQLRGQVDFCPRPGGGLTVRLTFPTADMERAG
jgi:two-component sensor histidine kinase